MVNKCSTMFLCLTLLVCLSTDARAVKSEGNIELPSTTYPPDHDDTTHGESTARASSGTKGSSSTTTESNTSEVCIVPHIPPGVKHVMDSYDEKALLPGETVKHQHYVIVKCIEGYSVIDQDLEFITCLGGTWRFQFPQCYKKCPDIQMDKNVYHGKRTPSQEVNFTLTIKCKKFYSSTSVEPSVTTTCGLDGRWSRQPVISPPCEPECGLSNLKPQNMTSVGKQVAKAGHFPWHASVYHKSREGRHDYVCSAVLISVRFVLTNYHCMIKKTCDSCNVKINASNVIVTFGNLQWNRTSGEKNVVGRSVADSFTYKDVFELLILDSDIKLVNKFVIPACIATRGSKLQEILSSPTPTVYVSGWKRVCSGDICEDTAASYSKLHYAQTDHLHEYSTVIDTFDGFKREDAVADKGSGLVIHHDNKYYLIGLFGGYYGYTQSYTKVTGPQFVRWINDIIRRTSEKPACTLPEYPHNEYKVPSCSGAGCSPGPGDKVDHKQVVLISCAPGYHMISSYHTHSGCLQGNWTLPIPKCDNVCPPLVSTTLNLECYLGLKRSVCSEPQPCNTTVRMSCKQHYTMAASGNIRHITCLANGTWSRDLPRCEPVCGQSDLIRGTHTPTIVGGKPAKTSNFPWNAALFLKDKGVWTTTVQCGGSLITTRAVLTASHCVTVTNDLDVPCALNTTDIRVALGKVHRQWGFMENTEVNKTVKEIVVHSTYRGAPANYHADIAILILSSEIVANRYISPVCLDFNKHQQRDLTSKSNLGYVVGWGYTEDCQINQCHSPSDTLLYTRTEVLPYHQCTSYVQKAPEDSPNLYPRVDSDKLCSGNGSESVIQKGDSGGGLVYVFGDQFFVYGVVSNKLRVEKQYSFGLFTNVTQYTDWITDIISRDP